ncbi:hypothetical protein [Klebsiella pneumoniae]|uniref:hypothetical protein n=1 Tax=Klebsiella pneumoniae TaxID=573 RepID=UPI000D19B36E|nr:hypothetical protein [Klebsiella pneumoniae]
MDKSSLKITELPALSVASENGFIPIAQVKEENDTYKVTLKKLRESVMFENAYTDTATGVTNTVSGDTFFVYTDATKEHVQGWVNAGSGATPLLNGDGEQVTYGTYALLNKALKDKGAIVQWVYNGGLSNGGEQTFTVPLTGNISVQEVYVDGLRQFKDVGFELDTDNKLKFTLASPVKANQTVVAICFGSDDIEKVNESLLGLFSGPNGASNIGTLRGNTVDSELTTIDTKIDKIINKIYVDALGDFNNGQDGCAEAIMARIKEITGKSDSAYVNGDKFFIAVKFGNGTYKLKDLVLQSGVLYSGNLYTKVIPHENGSWAFTTSGTKPFDLSGVRVWQRLMYCAIENMIIGDRWENQNDVATGKGGVNLQFASYVYLRNVRFRHIRGLAINGSELFDTVFDNCSVMYCGDNTDTSNLVPCVYFNNIGSDDATNAIMFNRFHLEANHAGMRLNKCRHLNFHFPKFERDETSHLLEGCQGVTFSEAELTWNLTASPQFDIYPVTGSDSWGVKFISPQLISSGGVGWYFRHSGTAGPLELLSPDARGISRLIEGQNFVIQNGSIYDSGPCLVKAQRDVTISNVKWRALKATTATDGSDDTIIITGINCSVNNSYFSSQAGSATDTGAFINSTGVTATTIKNNIFGGSRQYGIKATLTQSITDNIIDPSATAFGSIINQARTNYSLSNKNNKGFGVGSLDSNDPYSVAAGASISPAIVVGGSLIVVRVILNGAAAASAFVADSSNAGVTALTPINSSILSFTTGTAGDGLIHITKPATGGSITITNYSTYTATVILLNLNAHG